MWKHRKQNREFSITEIKSRKSEYERFIENVCAKDSKRIHALRTAIGYILHRHREESKAKAVILVDEKLTDSLEPEGRTGKSIFGKSLNHLRIVEILDGKTFDSKNRFNYQNVAIDCDIIMVDDAREKFPFETLFHDITAGIEIERKNMPAIRIPFEESPRFLITTNHGILGNSGSYRDRMVEYEFAPYYSDTFSRETNSTTSCSQSGMRVSGCASITTCSNAFKSTCVMACQNTVSRLAKTQAHPEYIA